MSRINATTLLLDNQKLKEQVNQLTSDLKYYKELNQINIGLIEELDAELTLVEETKND